MFKVLWQGSLNLCVHDWPSAKAPLVITGKIVYVRFHGPDKAYAGKYTSTQLRPWIEQIQKWRAQVERLFLYFNNDHEAFAVRKAMELKTALEK